MKTMKSVSFYNPLPISDPRSLEDIEVPTPSPGARDLLVEVRAVSVNPIDTKLRQRNQSEVPVTLGFDVAGVVVQVGSTVTMFQPGDHVYYAGTHTRPGANSEFHVVDERLVAPMPVGLSYAEAAALPLTSLTAVEALFDRMGLAIDPAENAGHTLLLIGAAGGVGSIAIQLGKLAGLTVIATASRRESSEWCKQMGADHVITHRQSLTGQLQALKIQTVDHIFVLSQIDPYWEQLAQLIAPQGKICALVDNAGPLDLNLLKSKSVTFCWEFMFTRPMYETADMEKQGEWLRHIAKWVETGQIRSTLTQTLSPINAEQLREAHAKVEAGAMIGKLVVAT